MNDLNNLSLVLFSNTNKLYFLTNNRTQKGKLFALLTVLENNLLATFVIYLFLSTYK